MFFYVKALHIIFVVTWFSGMFYIVRLFIYNREANDMDEPQKGILQQQYAIMIKRLWLGITWPSAVLTFGIGLWMLHLYGGIPGWLVTKLCFVVGLFIYHISLHQIYKQQKAGIFKWNSQRLRIWNELATVFLVAIVMLVTVKQSLSWVWGLTGLLMLIVLLMIAIKIYKQLRKDK